MIKNEPKYQPAPDPTERRIAVRGVKNRANGELVQIAVPVGVQEFSAKYISTRHANNLPRFIL